MQHQLGAGLDQSLAQATPVGDVGWQRQRAQEVAEIVSERIALEPDGISREGPAREPRPAEGVLALTDSLLVAAAIRSRTPAFHISPCRCELHDAGTD
jgi:hypothetical protein